MMSPLQLLLAAAIPTFTVITGFILQSRRSDSLEDQLTCFQAQLASIEARLTAIEATAFMWDAEERWSAKAPADRPAEKSADV